MPHHGERGRIAEEIIKGVLLRTLPKRFSVGTGVIVSAAGDVSAQTDIIIYENFHNSPLLSEFGPGVYPVEIVYATVEVKSVLTKAELRKSIDAIQRIRTVGKERHYIVPTVVVDASGGSKVQNAKRTLGVPPRSYIVAFTQSGLGRTYEDFKKRLCGCLDEQDRFVHGVCVLSKNWFAGRIAYKKPTELYGSEGHALLSLYVSILKGQQNFSVYVMDIDPYLPESFR
jgi:hypothetical protein